MTFFEYLTDQYQAIIITALIAFVGVALYRLFSAVMDVREVLYPKDDRRS